MEGGSIEVDGRGTVLTTRQCLLSRYRNPGLDERALEAHLKNAIGVSQVLWLDEGLEGDHTDGHIDTITRFVDGQTIVTATCDDRDYPNNAVLGQPRAAPCRARCARRAVPNRRAADPASKRAFRGQRLPLTYANFYVVNGAVLLPVYGDERDREAVEILTPLFPGRQIVPLMARALITGGGAFHCVTQQQPAGPFWNPNELALGVEQMAMSDVLEANVAKAMDFVRQAASKGATAVLLPELFEGYYWPQAQRERFFDRGMPWMGIRSSEDSRRLPETLKWCCRCRSSRRPATRTTTAWS